MITQLSEIIIASGLNFPDALAASPYAAAKGIPILLSTPTGTPAVTQKFLDAHAGSGTKIQVIGGSAAVAPPTSPTGISISLHAGADRYETATLVSRDLVKLTPATADTGTNFDDLVLARGDNGGGGADALSGGPLAAGLGGPVLLTDPNFVPASLVGYISGLGYDRPLEPALAYILGGTVAITAATATSWSNLLNGLSVVGGRSSTFRDTASGSSGSPTTVMTKGCVDFQQTAELRQQVFTLDVAGDAPGKLVVTAQFCENTPPAMSLPPPVADTETVLPGTTVTWTPTGGTASSGKVIGGFAGAQDENTPALTVKRRTSIDFVIDTTNLVGHLNFVNNGGSAIGDGVLALIGGASRQSFDGNFSVSGGLPAADACKSNVTYSGAIGAFTITINNMTWCKLAGSDSTSELYRISGGTVSSSGVYNGGHVISGVRRLNDLGLQIQTPVALVDVYASLDASLHAAGSSSPAMVQALPETDASINVSSPTAGSDADQTPDTDGCRAPGLRTGHTFSSAVGPPHFDGALKIQNGVRECQTDDNLGVVEPTGDGGNESQPCNALGDPNTHRTVLYTTSDGRVFRGRILSSAYANPSSTRVYGLTLLLEENNAHKADCPIPGSTQQNWVDDPGNSWTVVRLTVNAATDAITFAR